MTLSAFDASQVRLRVVSMNDLIRTPELLEAARTLTLHPRSGMNCALNIYTLSSRFFAIDAVGIFASYKGQYVGWCMLTREIDGMSFDALDDDACIHVFVDYEFRRRGIGTQLMKKAVELAGDQQIKIYDYENSKFFRPFKESYPNIRGI